MESILKIVEKSKERPCIRGGALSAALRFPPHLYHHTKPRQNSVKIVLVNWYARLIWHRDAPSVSLGKIVNLSTCQLVAKQPKILQIRQFDDFGRNWPYTKSRQNSEKQGRWWTGTPVLFDTEMRLQYHWVKLWIYRPVSWFSTKRRISKFVNLTISGGIGPIQSQDKTAKKGGWWTGSPWSYLT